MRALDDSVPRLPQAALLEPVAYETVAYEPVASAAARPQAYYPLPARAASSSYPPLDERQGMLTVLPSYTTQWAPAPAVTTLPGTATPPSPYGGGRHGGAVTPPPPYVSHVVTTPVVKRALPAAVVLPASPATDYSGASSQASLPVLGRTQSLPLPPTVVVAAPSTLVTRAAPAACTPAADWPLSASRRSLNVTWPGGCLDGAGPPPTPPPSGHELLPPMEFHFYRDPAGLGQEGLECTDLFQDSGLGLPPPPPPAFSESLPEPPCVTPQALQEADQFEAQAVAHEQRAEQLEALPPTASNVEAQIRELLEGQRALREELHEVRMQVNSNFHDLEDFRREAQQPMTPQSSQMYYDPMLPMHQAGPMPQAQQQAPQEPLLQEFSAGPPRAPRNLGYADNQDAFATLHVHATRGLGNLHSHATRAFKSVAGGPPLPRPGDHHDFSCC